MLFIPPVLHGPFDRRYIIAHFSFPGSPENLFGDRSAASFLVNQLRVPAGFWESLIATRSEYDLRYLDAAPNELIIDLLSSNLFKAYALPREAEIEAFSRYNRFDSASGCHYRLLPRNGHLLSGVQAIRPYSPAQFDDLLQRLDLSEQQLNEITDSLPEKVSARGSSPRSRLFNALLDYELVASADMVSAPLLDASRGDDDSSYTPAQPTLGPHDSPDYVAPLPSEALVPELAPMSPPESLDECLRRLDDAKARLQAYGYRPKYTDGELLTMAEAGELDDRFVVRFMESDYSNPDDYLGRNIGGVVKYWSTTFTQLENADSDPLTICGVLGIDYDPNKTYVLAIIDTAAVNNDMSVTLIPTYERFGEFANKEVDGLDPEIVKTVMTPEYSTFYAAELEAFFAAGNRLDEDSDLESYVDERYASSHEKELFLTRAKLHQELGANDHWTGDGTTKSLLPGGNKRGVVEIFSYDKNPKTLGQLGNNLVLVKTKPIGQ